MAHQVDCFIIGATRRPEYAQQSMSYWDFRRSPASVRLLVEVGLEHGVPAERLLRGSGVAAAQLDDPNVELAAGQELRVAANLLRLVRSPPRFGIDVGLRYRFSTYGLWGYGLISSATAADALRLALRFVPLTYAFTRLGYHEEGDWALLRFDEPDLDPELQRFMVERDLAAAAMLMRELLGDDFALTRAALRGPAPPGSRRLFGVEIGYGADHHHLAFDRRLLSRPLPGANPVTAAMCHQLCTQLLERRRETASTASLVRRYLATPGVRLPDLDGMARALNLSPRTLKRRLQADGQCFRDLLAQQRRSRADDLLRDPRRSLTEIADQLGFADLSSFSQAYKRWYGVAPGSRRRCTGSAISDRAD